MQSRDGGWGAFDADNDSELPTHLPFFDFGAVTDPPTADVTAHVVEMLACEPKPLSGRARGRWNAVSSGSPRTRSKTAPIGAAGVSTTSTASATVVPALVAAGTLPRTPW